VIYGFCRSSIAAAVSFHNARVFIFRRQTDRRWTPDRAHVIANYLKAVCPVYRNCDSSGVLVQVGESGLNEMILYYIIVFEDPLDAPIIRKLPVVLPILQYIIIPIPSELCIKIFFFF